MKLVKKKNYFFFICEYKKKHIPKKQGFNFNPDGNVWWSRSPLKAYNLRDYADEDLKNKLEKYYKKRQDIIKESFSDNANINIPKPDGIDYFPFQKAGIKYALERENTLIADDMGCISKGSNISINRGKRGFKIPIETLYKRFNGLEERKNWQWDDNIDTMATCVNDDGILSLKRVKEVIYKGKKECWKLTTNTGKELICTPDHVIKSNKGWQRLDSLDHGDNVFCNGKSICSEKKIVDISYHGEEDVYDLVVEDHHNFIANGIIVHNCGKTIQVAGIINSLESPKNILIVCPNTLKLNWKQELEKWLVHKDLTYSVNNMTEFSYADIMIINYEAFRYVSSKASKKFKDPADGHFNPTFHLMKDLQKIKKFDLLVLDESHKIKNWSSNTTGNIFKLKKKVERTVFLTGTPIMGKMEELWTTIKFFNLQKVFGRNKNEFMKKWCGAYWNPFMRRYESDPTQISEETYKRFQENLRIHFMIRRTKKQVLKELPEKIRSIVPVEIDRSQLKEFEHLSQDVVDATSMNSNYESSVFSSLQPSQIEELTELRQLSGNLKVQPAYEFIKDILSNDEKVVVFAHHVSVLENIYKKFRKHAVLVRGGISGDERHNAVTKFQNDPNIKVFVGQNDTASLGLTLTASNNVVIIESSWTPSVNLQIEDRLLRIGQENTVNVYYLVADKTLDAHIISTVIKKQKLFEKVIEKDNIL